MLTIRARNVNDAYAFGYDMIKRLAVPSASRYGDVLKMAEPVTTMYEKPCERALFDEGRDANPFFHVMEALWILGGRDDVAFLARFNRKMADFSDNGVTFHAPYGERLRRYPGEQGEIDQLAEIIDGLKANPLDRRLVASIWSPERDLRATSKDIPCNDMLKFSVNPVDGFLDLMVFCRSNDMVWGAYGANVVQFSTILEYVAGMSRIGAGRLWQISTDFHVYRATFDPLPAPAVQSTNHYEGANMVRPYSLVAEPERFDDELHQFLSLIDLNLGIGELLDDTWEYDNPYFHQVAVPLYVAWRLYRVGEFGAALDAIDGCWAEDWKLAGQQWLKRRINRRERASRQKYLGEFLPEKAP